MEKYEKENNEKKDSHERSFRGRWSERLHESKNGFTDIPNSLLVNYRNLGMNESDLVAVEMAMIFKWTVNMPYPTYSTIAGFMGKDRDTIQAIFAKLERKGLMKRRYVKGVGGNNAANRLDFKPLIKILEEKDMFLKLWGTKKIENPYQNSSTKEDKVRRKYCGTFKKVGETIKEKGIQHYE